MSLRLVGRLGAKGIRLPLRDGVNVLGSAPECDLRVDHPTVSRAHAELQVSGEVVAVRDLGSRNGTFVGERRTKAEEVGPGAQLSFGQVRLTLERVDQDDLEAAVALAPMAAPAAAPPAPAGSTVNTKPAETFALERLPGLVGLVASGADELRVAQAAGAALFETLPASAVEVTAGDGVLFEARRDVPGAPCCPVSVPAGRLMLRVAFTSPSVAQALFPMVEVAAALASLVQRPRGSAAPPRPAPPPVPEPPSVVPEVQRLYAEAARVARGDVGVLITGESGTGKEVLARYIHAASGRAAAAFVALNCAALPRDLLETELFGIERGVATGVEARAGKFELASGGTLFLDEIGDMALETQAKILRVLQEGEVYRIGGSEPRRAAVRVVAATNRDLEGLLASGAFREDLYYRVATWTAELPPLRRRQADVPNLAAHFLAREAARAGVRVAGISKGAIEAMRRSSWPGNIRQLEKEMARAVLFLGDGDLLDSSDLAPAVREGASAGLSDRLTDRLEAVERREIVKALAQSAGDVTHAAEALGLGRSTLYRRMKALSIDLPKA